MSNIISDPQTQYVKENKKRSNRNIPNIQKIIICFLNFQYILIHMRTQKLLKGVKGPPLYLHYSILSFF